MMNPQTILYAITIIGGAVLAIYTTYREFQNQYTYGQPVRPFQNNASTSRCRIPRRKKSDYLPNSENDDCCICLCSMESENLFIMECNHMFHKKCIIEWLKLKNVCPICRAKASSL